MRARVLEAFASWLTLRPGCGLPGSQLEQHPLVTAALEGLQSPETFDEAVDALVELIYSAASKGSPDRDSMPLIHRVVPAVSHLSCHSCLDCCRHVTRYVTRGSCNSLDCCTGFACSGWGI